MAYILLDPHFVLFIASYMAIEIALSTILYKGANDQILQGTVEFLFKYLSADVERIKRAGIPYGNKAFIGFRLFVLNLVATGLSGLVFYDIIKYRHVLTTILLISTLILGIASLSEIVNSSAFVLAIISVTISFVMGLMIGAYAMFVSILLIIVLYLIEYKFDIGLDVWRKIELSHDRNSTGLIGRMVQFFISVWYYMSTLYLHIIIATLDFVIAVLLIHGYIFF